MKNLKNMKLPEQVRDLVLLLTLGFVACAAFCGPDSDRDASKGRRGAMERKEGKPLRGPQVGPEGPWWREGAKGKESNQQHWDKEELEMKTKRQERMKQRGNKNLTPKQRKAAKELSELSEEGMMEFYRSQES